MALLDVAEALAATDPAHAERIAQLVIENDARGEAFAAVAEALAATDPARAERIARSITAERWKVSALVRIAKSRPDLS